MDALELIVDQGRPASAGRFFQLGHDLLALLDELTDVPVAWRLTALRLSSAVATVAPPPDAPGEGRVLRLVATSLESVEKGGPLPGEEWSPDAIRAANRFVADGRALEATEDWVPPQLSLVTAEAGPAALVTLTSDLAAALSDLQPFERAMPGSVRGELVGLNVSRGNRASLRLPNRRIVRVGFDNSLREKLKDALYRQVEISGLLRQDGDGRVFHVRADDINVLTQPEVRWADAFGIFPDLTGALSTDEWLDAARGEA